MQCWSKTLLAVLPLSGHDDRVDHDPFNNSTTEIPRVTSSDMPVPRFTFSSKQASSHITNLEPRRKGQHQVEMHASKKKKSSGSLHNPQPMKPIRN